MHEAGYRTNLCDVMIGQCSRGNRCFGIHDANRTALCPSVLRGTKCPAGEECDLTHQTSPQVAPTCLHFLRGHCIKDDCPYSHVGVSSSAPICRDFAYMGYCEAGAGCEQRHLRECPDYNNGRDGCLSKRCPLPHYDRASQMRRTANTEQTDPPSRMTLSSDSSDDGNSDDRISNDNDTDLDEAQDDRFQFQILGGSTTTTTTTSYQFPQEQDFVGL